MQHARGAKRKTKVDIVVYQGGEVSHYLPRKVWYALKMKGLIVPPKVSGEPWVIPPDKFNEVENLVVLEIEYRSEIHSRTRAGSPAAKDKKQHIRETILEGWKRAQTRAVEIAVAIRQGQESWFPCGGAWLSGVKRNTLFGRVFYELAQQYHRKFYWSSAKHASVKLQINGPEIQSMKLAVEANKAFTTFVNAELGTKLCVQSYID